MNQFARQVLLYLRKTRMVVVDEFDADAGSRSKEGAPNNAEKDLSGGGG